MPQPPALGGSVFARHVPLDERGRPPVLVEPDHPQVQVELRRRVVGAPLHEDDLGRLVEDLRVEAPGSRVVVVFEPTGHDLVAPAARLGVGSREVDRVVGEERPDLARIVRLPGRDVVGNPFRSPAGHAFRSRPGCGGRQGRDQLTTRRPSKARPRVTSSAYSRSPPTGRPDASRVTRISRVVSRRLRYVAVASPSRFGSVAMMTSVTVPSASRCMSWRMRSSSGPMPSMGLIAPPSTW